MCQKNFNLSNIILCGIFIAAVFCCYSKACLFCDDNKFTAQEKWVWDQISKGKEADLNKYPDSSGTISAKSETDKFILRPIRQLRSEFIKSILLCEQLQADLTPFGIRISGAFFNDDLDLSRASLDYFLCLKNCVFRKPVNMIDLRTIHVLTISDSIFIDQAEMNGIISERSIYLTDNIFKKGLKLGGAQTGARLDLHGSQFEAELGLTDIQIGSGIFIGNIQAHSNVDMHFAKARLQLAGDKVFVADKLDLTGVDIGTEIYLQGKFGNVNMRHARVSSQVCFNESQIFGSFEAGYAHIGESFEFRKGEVDQAKLGSMEIRGQLDLENVTFHGNLDIQGTRVSRNISLQDSKLKGILRANDCETMHQFNLERASVDGSAEMKGAKVGTALILEDAKFGSSVDLTDAEIGNSILMKNCNVSHGLFDLKGVRTGGTWYVEDANLLKVRFNRFTYSDVYPRDYISLSNLLGKHVEYHPDAYKQLANVLQSQGYEDLAEDILIKSKTDSKRYKLLSFGSKIWNLLNAITIRYGYQPELAGVWTLLFIILGSIVFWIGKNSKLIIPISSDLSEDYKFNPFIYSADVLIPVIDLGQDKFWLPTGRIRIYWWFHRTFGWVLATLMIVGLTGVLRN